MASRFARHAFIRSSRATFTGSRGQLAKRYNSTSHGSGSSKESSDMPWIVGSLVVFGPAFIYLVSPSSRKTAPHVPKSHAAPKTVQSIKDDEGTEVSGAEIAQSLHKAEASDVPKNADAEENVAEPVNASEDGKTEEPVKDATAAESGEQNDAADAPKVADEKDEQSTSEPEKEAASVSKDEDKSSALNENTGKSTEEKAAKPPTNMSEARQQATNPDIGSPSQAEDKKPESS